MTRVLLSGNEAIARGAWEAGAPWASAIRGRRRPRPSRTSPACEGVHAEWAPNEKVALEVAAGVSLGGGRALVTMKHVGLNVAADPLFTLAYTGVSGGLVVLVADDPGMHSSQNEQDSRNYAAFARVPMLEPVRQRGGARVHQARLRALGAIRHPGHRPHHHPRVALARASSRRGRAEAQAASPYASEPAKYVMMPGERASARVDSRGALAALARLGGRVRSQPCGDRERSTSASSPRAPATSTSSEALPEHPVLKIGMTPTRFPRPAIREFAASVGRLAVVEEADAYLKRSVRALGIARRGRSRPPRGELSPGSRGAGVRRSRDRQLREPVGDLPARPPLMCPGCPHRGVFHALRKLQGHRDGRHRLLHARRAAAAVGDGLVRVHGREHRDGARHDARRGGPRPSRGRRDRRLDLRALGDRPD